MTTIPGWKRAIVIGASSGIGEAIAHLLARQRCAVALVARREPELRRVEDAIRASEPKVDVRIYPHDATCYDEVPGLFQQICRDLGGLDVIIYAAGVMPRIGTDEYTFEKDRQIFDVNVLGAMAWLNEAAERFSVAKAGTIVGISSVAGDRGRRGQPGYCASKAAMNSYLESLRNRLGRVGVRVVTIKPGPVATPMTEDLGKQPMVITAEEAAREIVEAAHKGAHTAYVPSKWRPIMFVIRNIPSTVFKKLNI